MRIAIVGNGIVGSLAALYFQKKFDQECEIILIGPNSRQGMPLVGESIIEITTHFLEQELGMGEYLMRNQMPKYSLTYYFKIDPNDPSDRSYSVHCNEQGPQDRKPLVGWEGPMAQPASWLLNRDTFDKELERMVNDQKSIVRVEGVVIDSEIRADGHKLTVEKSDKAIDTIECNWLIDASGRKQLLARKFGLIVKPDGQRNCFWFRIRNFDRQMLQKLDALGPFPPIKGEPYHYDRYYSTHHFLGKGNWIWLIPQKAEDGSDIMSIGLTSHPDHFDHTIRSVEDFIQVVSTMHPVVSDLVKHSDVIDSNMLTRYHYMTSKVYSEDRWAIVGDAAFSPDPMFSNGLAFATIQLEQLAYLIERDLKGVLKKETVKTYSDAFIAPVISSQSAITNWYESMDDPYLSSLRLNWIEVVYFYMFLPLVINRCHVDPERLKLWKVMQLREEGNNFEIPKKLIEARTHFGKATPEHFLYKGKEKTNPEALKVFESLEGLYDQIEKGKALLKKYTEDVLERIQELKSSDKLNSV